jgi:hypothetical protein
MPMQMKTKRLVWITAGLMFSVILFYGLILVNDIPGGLSDRRMSKAVGLESTIHISLGNNPEEAVQLFRRSLSLEVIHQEPIEGGVLLFMKRPYQEGSSNLQVEYARKTRLGWKWVWGGGYAIGEGDSPLQAKPALNYMGLPKVDRLSTPFPLVFGDVLDPSINNVTVEIKGGGKYNAELIDAKNGEVIWFVCLPTSASIPMDIKGFNAEGELVASKIIDDPRDSGLIALTNGNQNK